MAHYGLILLAAGASVRLGRPKQLLPYQGKSLLRHIVQIAVQAVSPPVVIVLGAYAELLEPEVNGLSVHTVQNPDWPSGMASSIRCGLTALATTKASVDGVIIMVCDQPFVTVHLLNNLIAKHGQSGKGIIASSYENTLGTPALFDKCFFPSLFQLNGQEGAKKIILQHAASVTTVPFPLGAVDIDTTQDYERLNQSLPDS